MICRAVRTETRWPEQHEHHCVELSGDEAIVNVTGPASGCIDDAHAHALEAGPSAIA